MRKIFKKYFVPHDGNEHRPHFLRGKAVVNILTVILLLEVIFFVYAFLVIPNSSYLAAIFSTVLTDLTNESRVVNNVPKLRVSRVLEQAAARKAEDMARVGYFSHNGPDGKTPWEWLKEAGYIYRFAGENLAVNFIDSGDVVTAWMNSPGHKKNLLDNRFTEIGIGTARGVYQGRETIFVVQFFGKPVIDAAALASIEPNPLVVAPSAPESGPREALATKPAQPDNLQNETPGREVPTANVAGSETANSPGGIQMALAKISTSPNAIVSRLFVVFLGIVILSLALSIGIKINIQHPQLILNGSLIIAMLLGFLILNRYIALTNIII
ncbi:MAG: CAP domain-containing protein [Candidatus Liptonbacteria bacterium]|nr:CAP domain-containing protein [Candidatus Liptonbacteria bacterium]